MVWHVEEPTVRRMVGLAGWPPFAATLHAADRNLALPEFRWAFQLIEAHVGNSLGKTHIRLFRND